MTRDLAAALLGTRFLHVFVMVPPQQPHSLALSSIDTDPAGFPSYRGVQVVGVDVVEEFLDSRRTFADRELEVLAGIIDHLAGHQV